MTVRSKNFPPCWAYLPVRPKYFSPVLSFHFIPCDIISPVIIRYFTTEWAFFTRFCVFKNNFLSPPQAMHFSGLVLRLWNAYKEWPQDSWNSPEFRWVSRFWRRPRRSRGRRQNRDTKRNSGEFQRAYGIPLCIFRGFFFWCFCGFLMCIYRFFY